MAPKILCVAEKPAIAKAVANHLGGGRVHTVSEREQCGKAHTADGEEEEYSR